MPRSVLAAEKTHGEDEELLACRCTSCDILFSSSLVSVALVSIYAHFLNSKMAVCYVLQAVFLDDERTQAAFEITIIL